MALGDYTGFMDMIDGGGPGRSGDTFQGGIFSDALNSMGIRPAGYRARQAALQGGGDGGLKALARGPAVNNGDGRDPVTPAGAADATPAGVELPARKMPMGDAMSKRAAMAGMPTGAAVMGLGMPIPTTLLERQNSPEDYFLGVPTATSAAVAGYGREPQGVGYYPNHFQSYLDRNYGAGFYDTLMEHPSHLQRLRDLYARGNGRLVGAGR